MKRFLSVISIIGLCAIHAGLASAGDLTVNGKLGIGTTSPAATLTVNKAVTTQCANDLCRVLCSENDTTNVFQLTNTVAGATLNDGFQIAFDALFNRAMIRNRENGPVVISTNNTDRITIQSNGNVAIGTTQTTDKRLLVFGDAYVTGNLSKGGGTFHIDHPLDPANKDLYHGFVEAPRYDLIYRGMVQLKNGRATVNIDAASSMTDGTFDALTQNAQVFLQNDSGFAAVKGKVKKGTLSIECADAKSNDTIGWLVIAERADAYVKNNSTTDANGHLLVEVDKPEPTAEELALLKDKVEVVADGGQAAKDDVGAEDVVELSGKRGYPIHPKAFGKAQPQRKVIRKHVKKTESPAAHGFE